MFRKRAFCINVPVVIEAENAKNAENELKNVFLREFIIINAVAV